ncbi:hypothetical protein [Microbacterium hominis]|uniref:hypothetical protein n=1 Tax=Microbacterium hominis TaxID=162426 RepID=UPI001CC3003E|nr:hypothetical protein [Microbacterium hominis]
MTSLPAALPAHVHLRAGGTSVLVDVRCADQPTIVHWGRDLGTLTDIELEGIARAARPQRVSGGLDATGRLTVLPQALRRVADHPGAHGRSRRH